MKNQEINRINLISKYRASLMGAAILMILFCHLDVAQTHNQIKVSAMANRLHYLTVGVEIFFFLSGFGLYYSYTRRKPKYCDFEKRRLIRILPLYFAAAGITYLISDIFIQEMTISKFFRDLLFISYITGDSTRYWYILAIIVYYLLFPLLFRFIHKGEKGLLKVVMFSVFWWTAVGFGSLYSPIVGQFRMSISRLPIFMFGIYCGKLSVEKKEIKTWIIAAVTVIGYLLIILQKIGKLSFIPSVIYYYPVRAFFGLSIIITLISMFKFSEKHFAEISRLLIKVLNWLGGLTLECYLFHQSFMILLEFPYRPLAYCFAACVLPILTSALLDMFRRKQRKE